MKKMFVFIAVTLMSQLVFAQVKEGTEADADETNPSVSGKSDRWGHWHARKEMMKALNLTETQKEKLKEMKMSDKEKRLAILDDSKLSEEQKHEQLKELHNAEAKSMHLILTDEQKAKMKEAREKMRAQYKANPNKMHRKRMQDDKLPATEAAKQ